MPLPYMAIASAAPSIIRSLSGGANPNLRPQDKALAEFFYYAGDKVGLQHMLDAHQGGGNPGGNTSAWLYPTATHNYINSLMGQVTDGQQADLTQLQPQLDQVNTFAQQGYPYSPWELTRARGIVTLIHSNPSAALQSTVPPPPALPSQGGVLGLLQSVADTATSAGAAELGARTAAGGAALAQQQQQQLQQSSLLNRFTPVQMIGGLLVAVVAVLLLVKFFGKR